MKHKKKKKTNTGALLKSLYFLKPFRWLLTGGLALLILSTGCKLIIPYIVRFIIDNGFVKREMHLIFTGGGIIVLVTIIGGLFNYFSNLLNGKFSSGLAFNLRNQLYSHIQHLSFSFHDKNHTGQLLTRLTSDVELMRNYVQGSGYQIVISMLTFAGSFVMLFYTNWFLALFTIPFILFIIWLFHRMAGKAESLIKKSQEKTALLNARIKENITSIRLVKTYNREEYEIGIFDKNSTEYKNIGIRISLLFASLIPLVLFLTNISQVAILGIGSIQIIKTGLTIGEFIAFNTYMTTCLFQLESINRIRVETAKAKVGAERILQILETEPEITNKPAARKMANIEGRVMFNDVSFRYFEGSRDILQSVSFKTEPGQKIALLGSTGSGKSTIINLIPRFYEVSGGSITIDGIDIRDVTLESLRTQIGCVLQEPFLFRKSIRENIAYGKTGAADEEIIQAAKAAKAHDFIVSLPDGYDTVIAEKGSSLSGGQRQRIALARTLLIDPAILILDDSTSSVDSVTEQKIFEALKQMQDRKLCFIIAQRMSTVRNADQIFVLENGRIAARGSHAELLQNSPLYADIYYLQLKDDLPVNAL